MILEDRYKKWVNVSHSLAKIDQYLVTTVQGLGRLDVQQIQEDERYLKLNEKIRASDVEILRFSDYYTMAYLWVLGSYECIRTADQRVREDTNLLPTDTCQIIRETKQAFERVRIPLAKLEPASRHKDTDSHIAFPVMHQELGITWQVSSATFITRRVLSDAFLVTLESIWRSNQSQK